MILLKNRLKKVYLRSKIMSAYLLLSTLKNNHNNMSYFNNLIVINIL